MKYSLCVLFVTLISFENIFAAQIVLKPNLNAQMQKQEVVDKEKRAIDRKLANAQKLKELQAGKKTTTTTTNTPRVTLRDKVLAGTAVVSTKTATTAKSVSSITPGLTTVA